MRILVVTDLHDHKTDALLDIPDVKMVMVLGDVTTGGSLDDTMERILPLRDSYPELFVIPGNWEQQDSIKWLNEEGLSLHGKSIRKGNLFFLGAGGSIPTPFNTPNEISEEELAGLLNKCPETPDTRLVILSHTPPYGACDKVFLGSHVGSRSLRNFITERKPALVMCGHIHEARGVENINSTIVVNPGTAPEHYAIIELEEKIKIELI